MSVETRPLVVVKSAVLRTSSGSAPGDDRVKRWSLIELHCGHTVERDVTYRPTLRRGNRVRSLSDALPAPTRSRCDDCTPRRTP